MRFLPIVGSLVGFFPSDGRQLLWVLVADEFLENLYSLSELSNFSIYINRFASLSEPSVLGNFVDVSVWATVVSTIEIAGIALTFIGIFKRIDELQYLFIFFLELIDLLKQVSVVAIVEILQLFQNGVYFLDFEMNVADAFLLLVKLLSGLLGCLVELVDWWSIDEDLVLDVFSSFSHKLQLLDDIVEGLLVDGHSIIICVI